MKAAFPGQSLKGHMQASDTVPLEVMETGACCVWYRGLCGKEVCVVKRSVWYRGLCGKGLLSSNGHVCSYVVFSFVCMHVPVL